MRKNKTFNFSEALLNLASNYFYKKLVDRDTKEAIILDTNDYYVDSKDVCIKREADEIKISKKAIKKFYFKEATLMATYSIGYNVSEKLQKKLRKINKRFSK